MTTKIDLSNPKKIDLRSYKGDSGHFRMTASNPSPPGGPVDLTLVTWKADIKLQPEDMVAITSFDITPVDGDPSSVDVILSANKSALLPESCYYDIQMSVVDDVTTVMYGSIQTRQDVSRS